MVDIVIEGDTISEIAFLGEPKAIDNSRRPAAGDYDVDLGGAYVMPGFVDGQTRFFKMSTIFAVELVFSSNLFLTSSGSAFRELLYSLFNFFCEFHISFL